MVVDELARFDDSRSIGRGRFEYGRLDKRIGNSLLDGSAVKRAFLSE